MHRGIATSLFATIFTAIAAVIIYWYRGDIILLPAVVVIIGSISVSKQVRKNIQVDIIEKQSLHFQAAKRLKFF